MMERDLQGRPGPYSFRGDEVLGLPTAWKGLFEM